MTVLISGGTGFVGTAVTEALLARGERVVVFALDAPRPDALRILRALPGELVLETGDVRDADGFAAVLRRHQVDRLLPFAAVTSGPERESEAPEAVIGVNLLGFVAQMRAARDAGVRRVVAPSSTAVYGESFHGTALLREDGTPCVPIGIYGVTKYALERTALRLGALWGLDVVAARIGSVFGPWERDTGLRDTLGPHWQLARAAVAGQRAVLPAVLPAYTWVYARDVAAGILHLLDLDPDPAPGDPADRASRPRVFNVCSGTEWGPCILDWCRTLEGLFPGFAWRQSPDGAPGPGEVAIQLTDHRPRTRMDIARIAATGWAPRFGPDAAYAEYGAWVRAHPGALG